MRLLLLAPLLLVLSALCAGPAESKPTAASEDKRDKLCEDLLLLIGSGGDGEALKRCKENVDTKVKTFFVLQRGLSSNK